MTIDKLTSQKSSRIYSYLQSKKLPNGSFISAELAESDLRCVYCAILIANMINIDLKESDLFANTLEFILTCQNFDGGFGSIPRGESHTGYTFCAVACLELMGELDKCNINKLIVILSQKSFFIITFLYKLQ